MVITVGRKISNSISATVTGLAAVVVVLLALAQPAFSDKIRVTDTQGSLIRQIDFGDSSFLLDVHWRPDGQALSFLGTTGSNLKYGIQVMGVDGSNRSRIPSVPSGVIAYDWSPDSAQIVYSSFSSNSEAAYSPISILAADGSAKKRITSKKTTAYGVSWSDDGRIYFNGSASGNLSLGSYVYSMATDGTGLTRLGVKSSVDTTVAVSPDGTKVAYVDPKLGNSSTDATSTLTVVPTSGRGKVRVSPKRGLVTGFGWSQDSRRLVYLYRKRALQISSQPYLVDADGQNRQKIGPRLKAQDVDWSPDGTQLAFAIFGFSDTHRGE